MKATIISENPIPGLPSASGVEIIGPTAYVIGDDSPFLYLLDAATLAVLSRVPLFATDAFGTGRIPKASKPDLEAMAALTWPDGRAGVLVLGSGSTPARAAGWFVPVSGEAPVRVALARLYALLAAQLPAGVVLNLEAAATSATELLLFQRTVGRADAALLFVLPLAETLRFLLNTTGAAAPKVHQLVFELPLIEGCPAGFSGATFVDGRLFVSASVENTADAVLDGAVLGSFVGVVDVAAGRATLARLAWADGRPYVGKVEGLAVRQQLGPSHFELLLVTDDDVGGSTAATAHLVLAE
ncbi:hypothetical protein MON38_01460 [Hymenobacter sp. DH14]|uniref:Uncharacterized protein n=1 Tax=Hymenobacter cyanobacteriorum TaxID=2926463 RepID=A0A9X2AF45_9BACT|nr:hypothetical protein [Hymenobacter cyanobacteriorum]MCI1186068.1 hypothetical protein [Hymenobacter cyanobacteriorum]